MDAKDLRTRSTLCSERNNDTSKYAQSGSALPCDRNKSYLEIGTNALPKVEAPSSRPCAVIGPDRVIPPPAPNDVYLKKSVEPWPTPEDTYRRPPEYPHKLTSYLNPSRNISPRQTFQENMQRIMVPPTYNPTKLGDETSYAQIPDRNSALLKNSKTSVPPEPKYCDVPYSININSNDQKNVRNPEMCVPSVHPALPRTAPHGWPPTSANLRPRSYAPADLYQYQEYPSCAGPRPAVPRSHRMVPDETAYMYPDHYYQDPNIRFKPYPTVKERYPPRYEYIANYTNPFHPPPPFPQHRYDLQKSLPSHFPPYAPLKYVDNRVVDPSMEAYQRNQINNFNLPYRNPVIQPNYGAAIGSYPPNKMHPYPSDSSAKTNPPNKTHYDKSFVEYEASRSKLYPPSDSYFVNEMGRMHQMKSQVIMPNYPNMNMQPPNPYYKKDNPQMKHYEYMSHFKNMDPNIHNLMSRHPMFSPNTLAISPTDSITSNDTLQTLGNLQEDSGYVSQSSTTSIRSMDSGISRSLNDYYRRHYDPRSMHLARTSSMMTKSELNSINPSKDKKQIDVRQFLQMWSEGDEELDEGTSKEIIVKTGSSENNKFAKAQDVHNQEQLYVLGSVNVPSEELSKYEHIQKVSKLPENIKGYTNIELLNQFEEVIESSNINSFKSPAPKDNYHMTIKGVSSKQPGLLPRPVSPLDVEAKISQSIIHKEVGCNFEIKPCSPKMMNVDIAAPVQNILAERAIEKVANPVLIKSPIIHGVNENIDYNMLQRHDNLNITESLRNSSCKMINTPFPNNNPDDQIKNSYSFQDLESNSGLCLASLPRLDNDIELNFPEVNQQFINANRGDPAVITPLKDLPLLDDTTSVNNRAKLDSGHEMKVNPSFESEKETSKLSKYRKSKTNPDKSEKSAAIPKEDQTHHNIQIVHRTDSVIIKNPENTRKYEEVSSPLQTWSNEPNNVIQQDVINSVPHEKQTNTKIEKQDVRETKSEEIQMFADVAIDFSLNKHDPAYSSTGQTRKDTSSCLESNNESPKLQSITVDEKIENDIKTTCDISGNRLESEYNHTYEINPQSNRNELMDLNFPNNELEGLVHSEIKEENSVKTIKTSDIMCEDINVRFSGSSNNTYTDHAEDIVNIDVGFHSQTEENGCRLESENHMQKKLEVSENQDCKNNVGHNKEMIVGDNVISEKDNDYNDERVVNVVIETRGNIDRERNAIEPDVNNDVIYESVSDQITKIDEKENRKVEEAMEDKDNINRIELNSQQQRESTKEISLKSIDELVTSKHNSDTHRNEVYRKGQSHEQNTDSDPRMETQMNQNQDENYEDYITNHTVKHNIFSDLPHDKNVLYPQNILKATETDSNQYQKSVIETNENKCLKSESGSQILTVKNHDEADSQTDTENTNLTSDSREIIECETVLLKNITGSVVNNLNSPSSEWLDVTHDIQNSEPETCLIDNHKDYIPNDNIVADDCYSKPEEDSCINQADYSKEQSDNKMTDILNFNKTKLEEINMFRMKNKNVNPIRHHATWKKELYSPFFQKLFTFIEGKIDIDTISKSDNDLNRAARSKMPKLKKQRKDRSKRLCDRSNTDIKSVLKIDKAIRTKESESLFNAKEVSLLDCNFKRITVENDFIRTSGDISSIDCKYQESPNTLHNVDNVCDPSDRTIPLIINHGEVNCEYAESPVKNVIEPRSPFDYDISSSDYADYKTRNSPNTRHNVDNVCNPSDRIIPPIINDGGINCEYYAEANTIAPEKTISLKNIKNNLNNIEDSLENNNVSVTGSNEQIKTVAEKENTLENNVNLVEKSKGNTDSVDTVELPHQHDKDNGTLIGDNTMIAIFEEPVESNTQSDISSAEPIKNAKINSSEKLECPAEINKIDNSTFENHKILLLQDELKIITPVNIDNTHNAAHTDGNLSELKSAVETPEDSKILQINDNDAINKTIKSTGVVCTLEDPIDTNESQSEFVLNSVSLIKQNEELHYLEDDEKATCLLHFPDVTHIDTVDIPVDGTNDIEGNNNINLSDSSTLQEEYVKLKNESENAFLTESDNDTETASTIFEHKTQKGIGKVKYNFNCDLIKRHQTLKRSLSDSALNFRSNIEDSKENNDENVQFVWPYKRRKMNNIDNLEQEFITQNLCNIIQNNRRNSVASVYNEENVSFCILIENSCIIPEDETDGSKLCFSESTQDCVSEEQDERENYNLEAISTEATSPPGNVDNCDYSDSFTYNYENKTLEDSWVEDIACVETVISDDIAEDIIISGPSSPKDDILNNDEAEIFSCSEHIDKVKFIYGEKMCSDDAQYVDTLYNTPQMNVTKTLINREPQSFEECQTYDDNLYYDRDSLEKILSESNGQEPSFTSEYMNSIAPIHDDDIINCKTRDDKEEINIELASITDDRIKDKAIEQESIQSRKNYKTQDDTVHSCESSIDEVFSYELEHLSSSIEDEDKCFSTSCSPEVSSTTSEEKNSSILLKITNYKGSRVSEINTTDAVKDRPSLKFTEENHYAFPAKRPLLTKAAQKYIPPLKESISDLKVKLLLPQHSLMKLKQLKQTKNELKLAKENKNKSRIPIKPKPLFEDVLKSIDEIQFQRHKEKSKKSKKSIPKVVIKKNENGSHYASTTAKEEYNPDLTGRKWQPWVFLEKNTFIDKMAMKHKVKAIYSHRKNTYVLAEKFKKYKSVHNTKFVITQPKSESSHTGLKYTIRLKHIY